jgi:hypothetical protein
LGVPRDVELEFDLAGNLVLSHERWTFSDAGPIFYPAVMQKLDTAGADLWRRESTYAGSGDLAWTGRLAVDAHGNVLHVYDLVPDVTLDGESYAVSGGRDLLVRKRDADGNIVWSTQLGGAGEDVNWGLGSDPSDSVWVGSEQQASDASSGTITITKLVP